MSISDRTHKAKDFLEEDFFWKILLCGPTGSGKTTLGMTIPGRKLLIDLDGRAASIADAEDVEIYPILEPDHEKPTAFDELTKLIDEIWAEVSAGTFPYDVIHLSGLTKLRDYAMNKALTLQRSDGSTVAKGLGGVPAQPHYNPQMHFVARTINKLLPLRRHFVLEAHYDLFENKDMNVFKFYPKTYGNLRTEIGTWFNESYETRVVSKGGKPQFQVWTFQSGRMDFIKSALNRKGRYWGNPLVIDFDAPGPYGFERLMAYRKGTLKWEGGETKSGSESASTGGKVKI